MIAADAIRAALIATAAIPGAPLAVVCVLVATMTLLAAPFKAAQQAVLPDVLHGEAYPVGMALRTITIQGAQLVGFATGGLLIAAIDPSLGLTLDALTFVASALVIRSGVRRHAPTSAATARPSFRSSSTAGARAIWRDPRLRTLLAMMLLAGFYIVPEALAAPYATAIGAGPAAVGLIMAADPLGSVVGGFVFGRLRRIRVGGSSRRSARRAGGCTAARMQCRTCAGPVSGSSCRGRHVRDGLPNPCDDGVRARPARFCSRTGVRACLDDADHRTRCGRLGLRGRRGRYPSRRRDRTRRCGRDGGGFLLGRRIRRGNLDADAGSRLTHSVTDLGFGVRRRARRRAVGGGQQANSGAVATGTRRGGFAPRSTRRTIPGLKNDSGRSTNPATSRNCRVSTASVWAAAAEPVEVAVHELHVRRALAHHRVVTQVAAGRDLPRDVLDAVRRGEELARVERAALQHRAQLHAPRAPRPTCPGRTSG